MRSATGGLAAMLMSTPAAMSSSTALSSSLSTVNHQRREQAAVATTDQHDCLPLGHGHARPGRDTARTKASPRTSKFG